MTTDGYGPDEDTPAESPTAKTIRETVRAQMVIFRSEVLSMVDSKLGALEGRLCEALVETVSQRLHNHEQRLQLIEAHLGIPTEPCPPPSGAE